MSIFLGTDRTNNLLVLFNMAHVLALAITMGILYVLVKVISLVERGRALLANPRIPRNPRFLRFLVLNRNFLIFILVCTLIIYLTLVFIR